MGRFLELVVLLELASLAGPALGADMCRSGPMAAAETAINGYMKVLVENAPVACAVMKDEKPGRCSVLCFSEYAMDQNQRRAVLVYLVGAAGLQINKIGPGKFEKVIYIDRDLAQSNVGMAMPAEKLADLQHRAKTDQINAQQLIAEAMSGYKRMPVKAPAK